MSLENNVILIHHVEVTIKQLFEIKNCLGNVYGVICSNFSHNQFQNTFLEFVFAELTKCYAYILNRLFYCPEIWQHFCDKVYIFVNW